MHTVAQIIVITVMASTIIIAAVFGGLEYKLRKHLEELERKYERRK